MIGRRPYAAFGNSTGDQQMLEYTGAGDRARLMMLVHHDDAEREYAYGPESKIGTFSDALMAEASQRLQGAAGQLDIASLGEALGLGERQLRRRFEAAVGLAPKRFARLLRFQRVFEQQRESDAKVWAQVALECGYCDQAHFNRDFRAFSGLAPRQLLADADPLTAFFLSVSSKTAKAA